MSNDARLRRMYETMHSPGWPDIVKVLDEMAQSQKDELIEIMTRKPETLTGRIAIAKANRTKALTDFKDELYSLIAPVKQNG